MKVTSLGLLAILFGSMFLIGTTTSVSTKDVHDYDPWYDFDDDGDIDIFDIVKIAGRYGTTGTPVNKTALLYNVSETFAELLSIIENLNTTIVELENTVNYLNNTVNYMNSTINYLNNTVINLNETITYLNSTRGFGIRQIRWDGVIYQASYDGLLIGYHQGLEATAGTITIKADFSNPPTTVRWMWARASVGEHIGWCVPIKKGEYYKVELGGTYPSFAGYMWFIPVNNIS